MSNNIRQAQFKDICRISEIEIFNYRMVFFPIFKDDWYYFDELQVSNLMEKYRENNKMIENTFVYDDGVVKGFIRINKGEIEKLFVEPILHNQSIGSSLLKYAIEKNNASFLWALEKNTKAIKFYEKFGFCKTNERKLEDGTKEYLVKLVYKGGNTR